MMGEFVVTLYDLYWDSALNAWTIKEEKALKLPADSIEKKLKATWRFYERQFFKAKFRDKWFYGWVISGTIDRVRRRKLEWFASREQKYVLAVEYMKTPHPSESEWDTLNVLADGTYSVIYTFDENKASEGTDCADAVVVVIESVSFQATRPKLEYFNYKLELRRVIGVGGT